MLEDIGKQFGNIPMDSLIASPFLAVSKANIANVKSNIDSFKAIAGQMVSWDVDKQISHGQDAFGHEILKTVKEVYNVSALFVAEPTNFMIDEAEAKFTMEVSSSETSNSATDAGGEFVANGKVGWGPLSLAIELKGHASTHRENTRKSDNSAKYELCVRGTQHPPTEGMARVLDLMVSTLAPVDIKSKEIELSKIDGTDESKAKTEIEAAQMAVDKAQIKVNIGGVALGQLEKKAEKDSEETQHYDERKQELNKEQEELDHLQNELMVKRQALQLYRKYHGQVKYEDVVKELGGSISTKPLQDEPTVNE